MRRHAHHRPPPSNERDKPPPRFLSLEPVPRCPNRRCARLFHGIYAHELRGHGLFECDRPSCGARWWATRIDAGSVRDQFIRDFDDSDTVDALMALYSLPETVTQTMWWQVWLDGNQFHHFANDATIQGRSLRMLKRIVVLLKKAS